jgi:uncharacterized protein (TIGR02145 family)
MGDILMQRKPYLLVLTAIIAFIILTVADLHAEYICGDANADGSVNVSDAVRIVNYVFIGGDPPDPMETGDCNCDGTCNVSDAVAIVNFVFVGGYEPCDPNGDNDPDCDPNCPPAVTDYDGNVYQTVLIGDQCWMMENLKVTHYRDGNPIPIVTEAATWAVLSTGAYCNYDNDEGNVATYGRLYNWYAITDDRNIAPEGWHVPSDAEWKQLELYLGMSSEWADAEGWRGTNEGGELKEAGTSHWESPNTGATNESGFTALPGGDRASNGYFDEMGYSTNFWLSTEYFDNLAWRRMLNYTHSSINRAYQNKRWGCSVRCVKD